MSTPHPLPDEGAGGAPFDPSTLDFFPSFAYYQSVKRTVVILILLGATSLVARSGNPLSVGVDLTLGFYQTLISPLQGGGICNFSPSCSNFSRQSYRRYGPLWGMLMTFDRLERCNPGAWRHLGENYTHIEHGKLFDPVENHHLPTRLRELRKARENQQPEEERELSD